MQQTVMLHRGFLEHVLQFAGDRAIPIPGGDRPLVYLQIPQTASRGFTHHLKEHFRDKVIKQPPFSQRKNRTDARGRGRHLYLGQFLYAQWRRRESDAWLLGFLRDPVQRVVAQYHAHHHPTAAQLISAGTAGDAWRLLRFAQTATLEEYVHCEDPFLVSHLRDVQTRALSSFASLDQPQFLASAVENLEREFLFFGIAEFHQESLQLFRAQLGATRPYCSRTHRRHRYPPSPGELTDRALARIHELIPHDLRLYDHALRLFQVRCERLLGRPRREAAAA